MTEEDRKSILANVNRIPPIQLAQLVLKKELTLEELKTANLASPRYKIVEEEVEKKAVVRDWNEASNPSDADKLRDFIQRYDNKPYAANWVSQARTLLKNMEAAQVMREWEEVQTSNDAGRLRNFILRYQTGGYPDLIAQAQELLKAYEERDYALLRDDIKSLMDFIRRYPDTFRIKEIEERAWAKTDRQDKNALNDFIQNVPNSYHAQEARNILWQMELAEADDRAWQAVDENSPEAIARYLSLYPEGRHVADARKKLDEHRRQKVERFRYRFDTEAKIEIKELVDKNICEERDFIDMGIVTDWVMERIMERDKSSCQFEQKEDIPDLISPEGNTDIFLFGIPTSGKTCVLAGLINLADENFVFKHVGWGGKYAEYLQQCIGMGISPIGTRTNYVNVISASVKDERENKHPISLVEMSGEKVVFKLSNHDVSTVGFEDMGDGAGKLLANKNRKNIFFVIDPSRNGWTNVQDQESGTYVAVSQPQIICRILDLLNEKKNSSILKLVDSIHFIMAKSDMLDMGPASREERVRMATDIVEKYYAEALSKIKTTCKKYGINRNYEYKPRVYPFSLGRFMPGNYLEYDRTDSVVLMNVVKHSTMAEKDETPFDKVKAWLHKGIG